MHRCKLAPFWALLLLGSFPGQRVSGAATADATAKPFPDWRLEGAERRHNEFREEILLNGAWRWQPASAQAIQPESASWLYRNVPGAELPFFAIRDSKGQPVAAWNGAKITGGEQAWMERDFTVPKEWKNRRVWVALQNTLEGAKVWLDHRFLGYAWQDLPFDIPIGDSAGSDHRLTIQAKAITEDVRLCSAVEPFVATQWVEASWRQKAINFFAEGMVPLPNGATIRVFLSKDPEGREVVGKVQDRPQSSGTDAWRFSGSIPWDETAIQPWSMEAPNLYWLSVEVVDASGRVRDRSLAEATGLREFWIEGGDFMLNGNKCHLYGNNIVPLATSPKRLANADPAIVEHLISEWKRVGLNTLALWRGTGKQFNLDLTLEAADKLGAAVYVWPPDPQELAILGERPEAKDYMRQRIAYFVRQVRSHPSAVMYCQNGLSHVWDYDPEKLDGSYDPLALWPSLELRDQKAKLIRDQLRALDPTRPCIYHSGGNAGPVHTSMAYLSYDMDLQEQENWPLAWSKTRQKPLMPTEVGFPYLADLFARPTRGAQPQKGMPILILEYAAAYFGESWYRKEPDPQLTVHANGSGEGMYYVPSSARDELTNLFTESIIRSWRTYGINFVIHGGVRNWFVPQVPLLNRDPRRRGAVADVLALEENTGELTNLGRAAQQSLRPVVVYLGGQREQFTRKDHSYYGRERIEKSGVVLNDSLQMIRAKGSWTLRLDGRKIFEGMIDASVEAGARAFIPVTAVLPTVDHRQRGKLELEVSIEGTAHFDQFEFEVWPNPEPVRRLASNFYLFDPRGETRMLLSQAGIVAESITAIGPFPTKGVLIIGRHAIESELVSRQMAASGLDRAVEEGLKVVVFEQAAKQLWGLSLEQSRPRRTFFSGDHPVLQGIEAIDVLNWRNHSDLVPEYESSGQVPDPAVPNTYPLRLWKWGADNAVATYVFERPQIGAARAILVCGFDLMETPLLEVARGDGRILFCQLDVTNRYGKDPIATAIARNIFAYMDAATPGVPFQGGVLDPRTDTCPGWELAARAGNRFTAPLLSGAVASDTYFRPAISLQCVKGPGNSDWLPAAVGSVGGRRAIITALNVNSFANPWQQAKFLRLLAALRMDCGGTSLDGPRAGMADDAATLYPINWHEGFVNPYDHWRW